MTSIAVAGLERKTAQRKAKPDVGDIYQGRPRRGPALKACPRGTGDRRPDASRIIRGGLDPPGIAYVYAPDRKAERLFSHLADFKGVVQVDGYNAYPKLLEGGEVELAFWCGCTCGATSTNSRQRAPLRSRAMR
jgi:hypothetical protein